MKRNLFCLCKSSLKEPADCAHLHMQKIFKPIGKISLKKALKLKDEMG